MNWAKKRASVKQISKVRATVAGPEGAAILAEAETLAEAVEILVVAATLAEVVEISN
jgi:hypothetical protein